MNVMMAVLEIRPVDMSIHEFLRCRGGTAIQSYGVFRERRRASIPRARIDRNELDYLAVHGRNARELGEHRSQRDGAGRARRGRRRDRHRGNRWRHRDCRRRKRPDRPSRHRRHRPRGLPERHTHRNRREASRASQDQGRDAPAEREPPTHESPPASSPRAERSCAAGIAPGRRTRSPGSRDRPASLWNPRSPRAFSMPRSRATVSSASAARCPDAAVRLGRRTAPLAGPWRSSGCWLSPWDAP